MMKHHWPGNVRELRNFIERLAIMCPDEKIFDHHIKRFFNTPDQAATMPMGDHLQAPYEASDFKEAKKAFEREYLTIKLEENEGNISKTAETIGLERSHLHKKLKSLNILE